MFMKVRSPSPLPSPVGGFFSNLLNEANGAWDLQPNEQNKGFLR